MMRTIVAWGMQAVVSSIFAVGAFDYFDRANPMKEIKNVKLGLVWVEGVPTDFIRGDIASIAKVNNVAPARIHGYWYGGRDATGNPGQIASIGEKVLYYLHGKQFVTHLFIYRLRHNLRWRIRGKHLSIASEYMSSYGVLR